MHKFSYKDISTLWEDFLYNNNNDLDKEYNEETDYRTSTRGLKIRGVYDNYREAKRRSDQIAKFDKNHNVYIGQVGYWLPWDPDPFELPDQEYQSKDLNNLMKKYRENLAFKDQFFQERNREKMNAALRENKNAKKVSKETEEKLEKVRKTVNEKDKLLKPKTAPTIAPTPAPTPAQSPEEKESLPDVFDAPDPWLQRQSSSQ
jgi:hypothetical protein